MMGEKQNIIDGMIGLQNVFLQSAIYAAETLYI